MNDAWLAGLIEGEGSFVRRKNERGEYNGVVMSITSTDFDVLETALAVSGVGFINGPYVNKGKVNEYYRWRLHRKPDVLALLLRIYPYMHSRRKERIDECIRIIEGRTESTSAHESKG